MSGSSSSAAPEAPHSNGSGTASSAAGPSSGSGLSLGGFKMSVGTTALGQKLKDGAGARMQMDEDKKEVRHSGAGLTTAALAEIHEAENKKAQVVIPMVRQWKPASLQQLRGGEQKKPMMLEALASAGQDKGMNRFDLDTSEKKRATHVSVEDLAAQAAAKAAEAAKAAAPRISEKTGKPMTLEEQAAAALLEEAGKGDGDVSMEEAPLLLQNMVPGLLEETNEDARFKLDVHSRPDDMDPSRDLDRYERVPVEQFGLGMLMGMGYKPGDAIGKTNKAVVEPIEYLARPGRMGLGAAMAKPTEKKGPKILKPGQTRDAKEYMRLAPDADGNVRHVRKLSERLIKVHSLTLREGALVEIMTGPHRKLYGRIARLGDVKIMQRVDTGEQEAVQWCDVRLNMSEQVVSVPKSDFEILDEHALPKDHPAFATAATKKAAALAAAAEKHKKRKRSKSRSRSRSRSGSPSAKRARTESKSSSKSGSSSSSSKSSSSKSSSSSSSHRDKDRDREREKRKEAERAAAAAAAKEKEKEKADLITWIVPHIRVRVISKKLEDGRYYQLKARVEDVVDRQRFTVVLETGKVVEGMKQSYVESALPKAGGHVMVVQGKHKGQTGTLLERNGKTSQALVQLDSDMNSVIFSFDDVAEHVPEAIKE